MKKHCLFLVHKGHKTMLFHIGPTCDKCRSLWQVKPHPHGRYAECASCGAVAYDVEVWHSGGASRYAARGGSKRVGAYDQNIALQEKA